MIYKLNMMRNRFSYFPTEIKSWLGTYRRRQIDFYFLSTGRCGTKFFKNVLNTAPNAIVEHQPPPHVLSDARRAVAMYHNSKDDFIKSNLRIYPIVYKKMLINKAHKTRIYGETYNTLFPFAYQIYRFCGADRLRLVHLVREPVACASSILRRERPSAGKGFKIFRPVELVRGTSDAEVAANIWNSVNMMLLELFECIGDDKVTRIVRLEDVNNNVEAVRTLFNFLGLTGFQEDKMSGLMDDDSWDVRHSHQEKADVMGQPPVSDDEKEIIHAHTREVARRLGYG